MKQIVVGVIAVLSLSVSAVAACACSHHEPVEKPKLSCHGPAAHHSESSELNFPQIAESCFCYQSLPERSVKAESFKLKKNVDRVDAIVDLRPIRYRLVSIEEAISRSDEFHTTLYSLRVSSRGPPRA